jgi:hypothetical protein
VTASLRRPFYTSTFVLKMVECQRGPAGAQAHAGSLYSGESFYGILEAKPGAWPARASTARHAFTLGEERCGCGTMGKGSSSRNAEGMALPSRLRSRKEPAGEDRFGHGTHENGGNPARAAAVCGHDARSPSHCPTLQHIERPAYRHSVPIRRDQPSPDRWGKGIQPVWTLSEFHLAAIATGWWMR